jgi:TPR repeat protein
MRAEAWMGLLLQNRGRRPEAKEWWRRAAEKGNRRAINNLANIHHADREDEEEEAARWFGRGAEAGDLNSMHEYALLLLQGCGLAKDEQAAARWYYKLAAQGDGFSHLALAELYASGTGVAYDLVEAYALAAIAEAILDDSDLYGMRLARLKARVEMELSPTEMKAARLRAQAMRPELKRMLENQPAQPFAQTMLLSLAALGLATIVAVVVYRSARHPDR